MAESEKIRVLLVDDSLLIRRLLAEALSSEPSIEIVGKAVNGKMGLIMLESTKPDLLVLDIEMPDMNGLEMLKELRKINLKVPVIMFSTLTARAAASTLEALSLGASDYVTKPSNTEGLEDTKAKIKADLIPKILMLARRSKMALLVNNKLSSLQDIKINTKNVGGLRSRVDILTIGVSTGGPNALAEFMPKLPKDFPVPIVIVQHMPPVFTKLLADRLNATSAVAVVEAKDGDVLEAGKAYIAPGGMHMVVAGESGRFYLKTNQDAPENSCRPAVDVLLRSVSAAFGPRQLVIIMTGMGQDGLKGCEVIDKVGGQIFVQDEATSVVWGMPGFVAKAGLAEKILPLSQIPQEVIRRVLDKRAG